MIFTHYTDAKKNLKVGDEVWACAFHYTRDKEGKALYQKPILGRVMAGNTQSIHDKRVDEGRATVDYFVPYKQNGKDLAWSKAINIYSRKYATTEEECIKLFNELIEREIMWHESEIRDLKAEIIK